MPTTIIKKESIDFLKTLSKNNNRDWFAKHKDKYTKAHENMVDFTDALLIEMNKHDAIETASGKKGLYRIYKDVRFSKDKTPYNTYWSGSFKRATKKLRGGYYFHIQDGNSFVSGGFWGPEPNDIQRIRQDIELNYEDWKKLLANKTLVKTFGTMLGEQLISAPRGFDKNHPAINLLRYKQYIFRHEFATKEVLGSDFVYKANDIFKKVRPFFDYMSDVLTTDANGISVI
ncbi:MAG TPA: DUF2461 domain-containing protein [Bacteroidia bacterium]|nr:DUF2461 domain-containing protein [Bacteroidia bacterium]